MGFEERELWVKRKDPRGGEGTIRLFCVLRVPEEATGPLPTVVLSHGFTASHAESDPYGIALAEAGFVSVCLDFFGGGAEVRSDGTLLDMTIETEADDLMAVFDAVSALSEVDERRLMLLGCSQGGFVSTMAASRLKGRVCALMCMYPAYVLHDDAIALYPNVEDVPDTYTAFGDLEFSRVSSAYNLAARACDPYDLMDAVTCPVLIIHGDADPLVPISYSKRASTTFQDAEFVVEPGAGHGFSGEHLADACRRVVDFATRQARSALQ